ARRAGPARQPRRSASSEFPAAARFPTGKHWAILGGSAALLLLAMGVFLWLRLGTPGVEGVAPASRGPGLNKPDDLGQERPAPPSVPGREKGSPEERIARSSTGDAGMATSPSVPKGDAG